MVRVRGWVRARVKVGVGSGLGLALGLGLGLGLLGSPGFRLLRTRAMRSAVTLGSDVLPIGDGGIVEA